jgi:hypothetical protein
MPLIWDDTYTRRKIKPRAVVNFQEAMAGIAFFVIVFALLVMAGL